MAMVVELLAVVVLSETTRRVYKFVRNKNFVPKTIIGEDYQCVPPSLDQRPPVHHRPIIREVHSIDEEAGEWWKNDSVAFGPYYRGLESDTWKTAKDEAWEHVLRKSNDEGGVSDTTCRYVKAVRAVEREARGLYSEKVMSSLSSDEFIWIMIRDGCFLLQVAFFVLGGLKQLDHPIDDPTFGHQGNKALIRAAISSMFIVGNQIPSLVLKELMKQSFFKGVFNRGIWHQPLDLERCVLFKLLLVPLLDSKTGGRGPLLLPTAWLSDYARLKQLMQNLRSCKLVGIVESHLFSLKLSLYPLCNKVPSEDANDLLHGLWLLVTGLKTNSKGNETDNVDPDIDNIIGGGISSSRCGDYFDDIVLPAVRSAKELKEAGVGFKCNRNGGITNIKFKNVFFNALIVGASFCYVISWIMRSHKDWVKKGEKFAHIYS